MRFQRGHFTECIPWEMKEIFEEDPNDVLNCQQYYVQVDEKDDKPREAAGVENSLNSDPEGASGSADDEQRQFSKLLELPCMQNLQGHTAALSLRSTTRSRSC